MAEPVLKWAGGKRQLLSEITGLFPVSYQRYHEPFVGAGAVFFHMGPEVGTINDTNERLINFYRVVKRCPEELIEENRSHEHSESYYYDARAEFNTLGQEADDLNKTQKIRAASLLLYLNRTCFNGLYRENSSGEFNVPFGSYENPNWIQTDRIRTMSDVLQGTDIYNRDFGYITGGDGSRELIAEERDLVYCDPPYQPVSKTADFTEYSADGFDEDDQRRLRDVAVELSERGVWIVLSNSPPVAELYEDYDAFYVEVVNATRAINSDGENRGDVAEILITNVPPSERKAKKLSEFLD